MGHLRGELVVHRPAVPAAGPAGLGEHLTELGQHLAELAEIEPAGPTRAAAEGRERVAFRTEAEATRTRAPGTGAAGPGPGGPLVAGVVGVGRAETEGQVTHAAHGTREPCR